MGMRVDEPGHQQLLGKTQFPGGGKARAQFADRPYGLDESEMNVLAAHDTAIAHCPTSNMKLASGIAPVSALRKRGIAVGLGSDGEKENNNLDLLEEMKIAGLLASLGAMDPRAMDAWSILRMATIDGARALGMADEIGSLEPGKRADIIAVALDTPRMSPLLSGEYFNLHYNLVYGAQGGDVTMTMVDGHIRAWQGQLMASDLQEIQDRACHAAWQLLRRRDALSFPVNEEMHACKHP